MSICALLQSAQQYPRHCFANISVDHHEFGRWQYRNELRRQDASPLLPVIDANVVPECFGARVGHEKCRAAGEVLSKILRHCIPAMFVGASSARGKVCNGSAEVANTILSHQTKCGDPVLEQFATGRRA